MLHEKANAAPPEQYTARGMTRILGRIKSAISKPKEEPTSADSVTSRATQHVRSKSASSSPRELRVERTLPSLSSSRNSGGWSSARTRSSTVSYITHSSQSARTSSYSTYVTPSQDPE